MVDDRGMSAPLRMARYSRLLDMAQRPDKTGGTMSHPEPTVSGVALGACEGDGPGQTTSVPNCGTDDPICCPHLHQINR